MDASAKRLHRQEIARTGARFAWRFVAAVRVFYLAMTDNATAGETD